MDNEMKQCAHEICVCAVKDGEEYCSPNCEANSQQDVTSIKCDCGHSGCDR